MPDHGRHDKPSIPVMWGNIYSKCVQSLLPLMLCISGTTIATRHDQARRVDNASCLGPPPRRYRASSSSEIDSKVILMGHEIVKLL